MRIRKQPTRRARVMTALAEAKLLGQPVESGMNLLSFEQPVEFGKFSRASFTPKLSLWQRAVRYIKQLFTTK